MPKLEDNKEQEVEEIRDEKEFNRETFFLIKQKGQLLEFNQQIAKEDAQNTKGKIIQFR